MLEGTKPECPRRLGFEPSDPKATRSGNASLPIARGGGLVQIAELGFGRPCAIIPNGIVVISRSGSLLFAVSPARGSGGGARR
jgi:hypothetical protein